MTNETVEALVVGDFEVADEAVMEDFEGAAPARPETATPDWVVHEADKQRAAEAADGIIPMYVVRDFEFHTDVVGGYEVVIMVLDADNGVDAGPVAFALPSEDVIRLARAGIGHASTVRPVSSQEVIKGLDAQNGETA